MTTLTDRIAGAPISWGVCEVPDWGHQLAPDRVLAEMSELGLAATEFGPEGFLPAEPRAKASVLASHNLRAVGGFVPVILHRVDHNPVPALERSLAGFVAAGADVLVLAAATGIDGYDAARPVLTDAEWDTVFANLDALSAAAARSGIQAVLHPHVGTMVETEAEIERVLTGSKIPFCLDTGHLLIGGTDPVAFAAAHADRVAHTHLKDVDLALAEKVRAGTITYYDAVIAGLYRPLGQGDVDVRAIVSSLVASGYTGWFVLEQDNVLRHEPEPGEGPLDEARASVEFLRSILATLPRAD